MFILGISCYIFSMVVVITCFLYQKTKYFCWWQILKSFHMAIFMWMIIYNTIHPLFILDLVTYSCFLLFLLQYQIRTRKRKCHSYGNWISIIEMWSLIYLHITFFARASYYIFPKWLPNHFIPLILLHATFHSIIIQPLRDYKKKKT